MAMETTKRNRMITGGIAAALILGYLLGVYLPQRKKLKTIAAQTLNAKIECESKSLQAAEIPQLISAVEEMRLKFKNFDQCLPPRQELPEFLREISDSCMGGDFDSQVIKPGSPRIGERYNCLPIFLSFDCSYTDLVEMLGSMGTMARLNRVESLKVTPKSDDSNMLTVKMQVNIYFAKS